jgi:predicted metal-dependent phosphoesterase TrpH
MINTAKAKDLIRQGYFAIDPHCHSSFSYDVPDVIETSPENVVAKQINLGLKPLITDHDTLNGYNFLKSKGISSIPAVELTIKPTKAKLVEFDKPIHTLHINIFGLNNKDFKILNYIALSGDLDLLVEYMKSRDLDWMYNHPFWHESGERLNWKVIPGLAKNYFDVVEINSGFTKSMNDLTIKLAEKQNKGIIASTDNHTGNPGVAISIAEGRNFKEFWNNVKEGKSFIVRKDMSTLKVVKETTTTIDQIFRSNIYPEEQRKYVPDLGLGLLNKFAKLVTSGSLKDKQILKKVMQMIFHTINYTAGPAIAWKYHINKTNTQIQAIHQNIDKLVRQLNSAHHARKKSHKHAKPAIYVNTALILK